MEIGTGSKEFYIVAEMVSMGIPTVAIQLTENKIWAKQNNIIGKVKANSLTEAKTMFKIQNHI